MKLSTWAKLKGINYHTAYRWFNSGLIKNAIKLPTGTILVNETINTNKEEKIVTYSRVSNHSRKNELEYQVERLSQFCLAKGYSITKQYKEIASGMNDNRKQLWEMLNSEPTIIVIENKDRLTRFGFNYLEKLLEKQGCKIEVINKDEEDEKDLIKDLVSIITSFCCRIYGIRRAQNKINKIKQILKEE
jgi:predicted site-specific integrase-resolvase